MYDVAIIGCGIIGAAAAHALSMYSVKTVVLEKENDIALGATRANSAIIHAGFDPEPGTLMARLNVRGCELAPKICAELDVPYKNVGSLVLAFSEEDDKTIRKLYERGVKNGVPGLEIISKACVLEMEKYVSPEVTGALYAPSAGIVNPWEYALALAEVAVTNGAEIRLGSEVMQISRSGDGYIITTASGTVSAKYVINASGENSDTLHNMVAAPAFTVKPTRGDYYLMDKAECFRAKHTLFQCPSNAGKGVLISPTVHGNLLIGPNAVSCADRERVNTTADGLDFVRNAAAKTIPDINYRNSIRNFAGMRANTDKDDFIIGFAAPHFLDLAGIKSPGLTAAPAIAEEALKLLAGDGLRLEANPAAVHTRRKLRFKELTNEEKIKAIAENPLYGRVICRCETITEGEIVDAIRSPIPPVSVDGIKRRAGTGMGRCQGGFCGPRVLDILARETGLSPLDILKDKNGSYILCGETKTGGAKG